MDGGSPAPRYRLSAHYGMTGEAGPDPARLGGTWQG